MKINLSKILKYISITCLNILCIFVLQYYVNNQNELKKFNSDLKIALTINKDIQEDKDIIISKLTEYNKFDIVEYIDLENIDRYSQFVPELENIISKEILLLPTIVLINNVTVPNFIALKELKTMLLSSGIIENVEYDSKAYEMFFSIKHKFELYKKIFTKVFIAMIILFVLKMLFFFIKSLYAKTFIELGFGLGVALVAYGLICLIATIYPNSILKIDWCVMYIILPFSAMIGLLVKESNA